MNSNSVGESNVSCIGYKSEVGASEAVYVSLQIFIFAFGLVGNAALIFVVATRRSLRTVPNLFITNLAIADCIYLLLFIPCNLISTFGIELPLFFCKVLYFCRFLTLGVSVFTLLAMSIDRCMAITRPMSVLKSSRPELGPKIGLVVIWLLAVLLSIPWTLGAHIVERRVPLLMAKRPANSPGDNYSLSANSSSVSLLNISGCLSIRSCFPFPDAWGDSYRVGMLIGKLLAYYLVPGLLIAVFYGKMAGRLIRSSGNRANGTAATATVAASVAAVLEGRRKLAKLSLCLALVFFVAWGPDYLVMLHFFFWADRVSASFLWLKMVAKVLPSAYSASNPVTLCVISRRFRRHLLSALTCARYGDASESETTAAGLCQQLQQHRLQEQQQRLLLMRRARELQNRRCGIAEE